MQRQIIHGVPYFIDSQNKLYLWESEEPAYYIGTYAPDTKTVSYEPNCIKKLSERLDIWRNNQVPRTRNSTNTRKSSRNAPEAKDSDDDE